MYSTVFKHATWKLSYLFSVVGVCWVRYQYVEVHFVAENGGERPNSLVNFKNFGSQ